MKQTVDEFLQKIHTKFGDAIIVTPPAEPVEWTKITLTCTCKMHGIFYKKPYKLLESTGCPECSKSLRHRLNFTDFVKKAKLLHKNMYEYSSENYNGTRSKIHITCKTHGIFTQRVSEHLSGHGCPGCSKQISAQKHRKPFSDFENKANEIHNFKYTYKENTYTAIKDKVVITCPIHDDFKQAAYSHLQGVGCPLCATSGFDEQKPAILYYLKVNGGQAYKIGITNKTVQERFSNTELQLIEIIHTQYFPLGKTAYLIEQKLLNEFKHLQYTGSQLLQSGNTELFTEDITKGYQWQKFLTTYQ